ncbi:MAG: hypothetical protein PHY93_17645 [Bacteriovorax sp.]|nr:hypothetical protein [Bacteriovorax sp.]
MKKLLLALLLSTAITNAWAKNNEAEKKVIVYANATAFTLDANLPEPFSRTVAVQVSLNPIENDATLTFLMDESEGIEVTFDIISDTTDKCNNREIVAGPPVGSTPYYKDFEIKVIDYSKNTCKDLKVPAATFASLKTYEVGHKTTTYSTILAEALQPEKADKN